MIGCEFLRQFIVIVGLPRAHDDLLSPETANAEVEAMGCKGTRVSFEPAPMLRRQRVLLDRDLATIYGVTTGRLNEAVKRNAARFPEDFMFQLTADEVANLRSQIAISSWGGRRYRPFVFTEYGAIQAANVLRSAKTMEMSIFVVRAFVHLRQMIASNKELAQRVDELERRLGTHDQAITRAF